MFLRTIFFCSLLCLGISIHSTAQSIQQARLQALGSTVTVRGMVTSGPELGKIRYLQDGTAGIAAFPGTGSVAGFEAAVNPGDSLEVTGILVDYQGLLEISPITAFSVISSGNPIPSPKKITFGDAAEGFESQLVSFDCVTINSSTGIFSSSGTWTVVNSDGQTMKLYLRLGHPMVGSSIPADPIELKGILSDFNGFQILPRYTSDLDPSACFYFTEKITQSNISVSGFDLAWATNLPADCIIHYGLTPMPDQMIPVQGTAVSHTFGLNNLASGQIYWVQAEARHNGETIFSPPVPLATRSVSSGQIKTYFNKGIDWAFANGYVPDGETSQDVITETIARINAATQTLDVAMYNNNRADLTQALEAAFARGVQVRYVGAAAASNPALNPPPSFPILLGNTEALMHNKFMVIDADLSDKAWVMGGSLNWTNQNINTDFNNTLFIQDQSLARAYRLEFEEMWGSQTPLPNVTESRFGSAKFDNTPHQFVVAGHPLKLYFSPSDQTTSHLEAGIRTAQSEFLFALFSFTKNELGDAIVEVSQTGVPVRGIMENISDVGAEYFHLLANNVPIRHHNLTGEFHHKYAVVDAYDLNSNPMVLTGSHNWSNAAETSNDENLLILEDPGVAALYKAEFEKRWGAFPVSTHTPEGKTPFILPNPASEWLEMRDFPQEKGIIVIKNTLGQLVYSHTLSSAEVPRLWLQGLKAGQYYLTFSSQHGIITLPFQKI